MILGERRREEATVSLTSSLIHSINWDSKFLMNILSLINDCYIYKFYNKYVLPGTMYIQI